MGICLLGPLLLAMAPIAAPLQLPLVSSPARNSPLIALAVPGGSMDERSGQALHRAPEPASVTAIKGEILKIEFTGLHRISPETLRLHIHSRAGAEFDRAQVQRDVRDLEALGWFDSVEAQVFPDGGTVDGMPYSGLRLAFQLKERPYLADVEFQGSRVFSRDHFQQILSQQKIKLRTCAPVDRFQMWQAAEAIQAALKERGHAEASVRVRLIDIGPATVRARFEIEDGPRVRVASVKLTGNHAFSDKKLDREMKYVAPSAHFADLRSKDVYTSGRLDEDLNRVIQYYRDHGYPEARTGFVKTELRQDSQERRFPWPRHRTVPRIYVSVPIIEGGLYRVRAVDFHSDSSAADVPGKWRTISAERSLAPGRPYSEEKIEGVREVLSQLPAEGDPKLRLAAYTVTANQDLDPAARTAAITYSVHDYRAYTVRRLEFVGERKFSDRYYRRHMPLREGDPYDPRKLEAGLQQLKKTGYVRAIKPSDVKIDFDEPHHTVDLTIRVTEIGLQKFSLSGGRSNLGNSVGLAYSIFNLLGGDELIASELEATPDSVRLALTLTEEGLFGTRTSFALSVFQDVLRPNLAAIAGHQPFFKTRSSGVGASWAYPVAPSTTTLTTTYTLSRQSTEYAVGLPSSLTGVANDQVGSTTNTSNHAVGLRLDTTDGPDHWVSAVSASGGLLGGDEHLVRTSGEYDSLEPDPITGRNWWAFRTYMSGVGSYDGNLLLQDRLFPGSDLLRGFRSGEIGPYAVVESTNASGQTTYRAVPTGADMTEATNIEYRIPIAPRTQAVAFIDSGSGWLVPNWLGSEQPAIIKGTNGVLRVSTGAELRFQLPVVDQPLRIDLALNPLRLVKDVTLPDGSQFRSPDRLLALDWGLGPLF
jgi:outer membrane protein assembly complex protein YaeT